MAFWELSTTRQIGMASGPIPTTAINDWIDREGYGETEAADFRRCIRAMDAEVMGLTKEPLTAEGMGSLLHGLAKG